MVIDLFSSRNDHVPCAYACRSLMCGVRSETNLPSTITSPMVMSFSCVPSSYGVFVCFFSQGTGSTFVVYIDEKLRVFRSDTGGVVVQTKADEVVPV